jgi:hypothetical protein
MIQQSVIGLGLTNEQCKAEHNQSRSTKTHEVVLLHASQQQAHKQKARPFKKAGLRRTLSDQHRQIMADA